MIRGPRSGKTAVDHVANATAAWGDPPDWIVVLAEACGRSSQSAVARQLNYSASTVSQVLSRTYRGDLGLFEQMVRGALMAETVDCPALGVLSRDRCLNWQKKPFATSSSHRVRMYQACRSCPQNPAGEV